MHRCGIDSQCQQVAAARALLLSGSVDGHALANFEFILAQLLPLQRLHDRVVEDLLEII
jgi:hypothetical protein